MFLSSCGFTGFGSYMPSGNRSYYYTVKPGDTLSRIGNLHGVTYQELARLNGLRNAHQLQVGQRLLIVKHVDYGSEQTSYSASSVPKYNFKQGELLWPVDNGTLASQFGPRNGSFHDGLDISAPSGSTVNAAHNGRVIYSGSDLGGYGNLVILRSEEGLTTVYAHNRRNLVSEGQLVKRGQKISEVGQTGHATGPHLHFEVRVRDSKSRYIAVDPIPLLDGNSKKKPRYRVNESLTPLLVRIFN
jgi:murein DD-endopeptidase MepM/ murein hydrolase activator NlpD